MFDHDMAPRASLTCGGRTSSGNPGAVAHNGKRADSEQGRLLRRRIIPQGWICKCQLQALGVMWNQLMSDQWLPIPKYDLES
jgi:hypothetical protein